MADPDHEEIHGALIEVAKKAGAMITSARPSQGALDTKKNCLPRPHLRCSANLEADCNP